MSDMLFDFLGKFGLFLALGKNLVTGVKDCCVVTAAKGFANTGVGKGPSGFVPDTYQSDGAG